MEITHGKKQPYSEPKILKNLTLVQYNFLILPWICDVWKQAIKYYLQPNH